MAGVCRRTVRCAFYQVLGAASPERRDAGRPTERPDAGPARLWLASTGLVRAGRRKQGTSTPSTRRDSASTGTGSRTASPCVSQTVEDEESPREELETEIEELRSALQTLEGRLGPLEELHTGVSVRQQAPTHSGTAPTHMLLGGRARAWLGPPHIRRVVSVLRAPRH